MHVTGGMKANHIIVNMLPGSTELKLDGGAAYYGTFLAVQDTNIVTMSEWSYVIGSIAGHSVNQSGGAQVEHSPFECPPQ